MAWKNNKRREGVYEQPKPPEQMPILTRVPSDTKNQDRILALLQEIDEKKINVTYGMNKANFEGILTPDFFNDIEQYIALILALYDILYPKIVNKEESAWFDDYQQTIADISDYHKNTAQLDLSQKAMLMRVLDLFREIERSLRQACEELDYTSDKVKSSSATT